MVLTDHSMEKKIKTKKVSPEFPRKTNYKDFKRMNSTSKPKVL